MIFLLMTGVYCCGWVSNGPVFVILGTMSDAFRTARVVLSDIASCRLSSATVGGAKDMLHLLHKRGVLNILTMLYYTSELI